MCWKGLKDFRSGCQVIDLFRPGGIAALLLTPFFSLARDGSGMQVLVEMARQGKGFDLSESIQDLAEARL